MNKQTEKLLNLIKENPELRVVPFVYNEICQSDYSYWIASFGDSEVTKIYHGEE